MTTCACFRAHPVENLCCKSGKNQCAATSCACFRAHPVDAFVCESRRYQCVVTTLLHIHTQSIRTCAYTHKSVRRHGVKYVAAHLVETFVCTGMQYNHASYHVTPSRAAASLIHNENHITHFTAPPLFAQKSSTPCCKGLSCRCRI